MSNFFLHLALFLLVGWLISLGYFTRDGKNAGEIFRLATFKLGKYTLYTAILVFIMWGLETFLIAS